MPVQAMGELQHDEPRSWPWKKTSFTFGLHHVSSRPAGLFFWNLNLIIRFEWTSSNGYHSRMHIIITASIVQPFHCRQTYCRTTGNEKDHSNITSACHAIDNKGMNIVGRITSKDSAESKVVWEQRSFVNCEENIQRLLLLLQYYCCIYIVDDVSKYFQKLAAHSSTRCILNGITACFEYSHGLICIWKIPAFSMSYLNEQ